MASDSTSSKGRVIIVGAGYGGLATAIELNRKGYEVEVFEAVKQLTTQGDVIHVGPSGSRVLSKWGSVLDEAKKISGKIPVQTYFDSTGKKLLEAALETGFDGYPDIYCNRGEVQRLMYNHAISMGIKVHFDAPISRYFEKDDCAGVFVGDEEFVADGVIACDGIHSKARMYVTGTKDRPQSSGFAVYRSWFDLDLLADDPLTRHFAVNDRDEFHVWLGPDVHAIVVTNISLRGAVCFCTHKDNYGLEESWSFPGKIEDVLKVVEGWDPTIRAVIEKIPKDRIIDWKLLWRDPVKKWVSNAGRVVLVGDAAHPHLPTSGTGAVQAIEDSATIAAVIDALGVGRIPLAFRVFERLRYERTSLTQRLGWETRHRWHQTDWEAFKKNPGYIKAPQPIWIDSHDAEQYAYDNTEAAAKNIENTSFPFSSTNLPEGYVHEDWTVESMMALEKEQAKENKFYRVQNH